MAVVAGMHIAAGTSAVSGMHSGNSPRTTFRQ